MTYLSKNFNKGKAFGITVFGVGVLQGIQNILTNSPSEAAFIAGLNMSLVFCVAGTLIVNQMNLEEKIEEPNY